MSGALLMAAMVALPLASAAVTLFLPARACAITNLVAGLPLGGFGMFEVVTHVAEGAWHGHLTLAALAAAIAWLNVGLSVAGLRPSYRPDASSVAFGGSVQSTLVGGSVPDHASQG
jgi:hypothetical protein